MKRFLKILFNSLGFEIKKCQVIEKNRYTWLKQLEINTIFDIGANVGKWTMEIDRHFPDVQIYSFEPLHDCYVKLEQVANNKTNIKTFNYALGNEQGTSTIYRSSQSSSSSLLKMGELHKKCFPQTSKLSQEKIQIQKLDEISKDLNLQKNIFIKIDVQGFEKNVINGGKQTLRQTKVLLIETSFKPLYEGQPLFDEIYTILKEIGFKYMGDFESIKNPNDGSILQANAIFINENIA